MGMNMWKNFNHKYGMSANGSKLEKAVGEKLHLLQIAGEIRDLREQVRVKICCKGECSSDMCIHSIVDFSAIDNKTGEEFFVEAKGMDLPVWRLKRRLWLHNGSGKLQIWKGSYKHCYLDEEIAPA